MIADSKLIGVSWESLVGLFLLFNRIIILITATDCDGSILEDSGITQKQTVCNFNGLRISGKEWHLSSWHWWSCQTFDFEDEHFYFYRSVELFSNLQSISAF